MHAEASSRKQETRFPDRGHQGQGRNYKVRYSTDIRIDCIPNLYLARSHHEYFTLAPAAVHSVQCPPAELQGIAAETETSRRALKHVLSAIHCDLKSTASPVKILKRAREPLGSLIPPALRRLGGSVTFESPQTVHCEPLPQPPRQLKVPPSPGGRSMVVGREEPHHMGRFSKSPGPTCAHAGAAFGSSPVHHTQPGCEHDHSGRAQRTYGPVFGSTSPPHRASCQSADTAAWFLDHSCSYLANAELLEFGLSDNTLGGRRRPGLLAEATTLIYVGPNITLPPIQSGSPQAAKRRHGIVLLFPPSARQTTAITSWLTPLDLPQ
ncbi:hypothetical protein CH63R_07485 [Colletotrichum higginsianum IMI 349063]|uniref:Uncharacterized protein n=1 Tax=Colletotrichum higginsianum (strain IMI 349063) TaxID=759273 RepID=A0A1B7Y9Q5_COLHI|nr:hypothetical protein CH63R_07485 [Colletotrichum higginsianum IMI 349063]OBR08720.1 hypothetical protein CH63R_07485 [Colletotrichum higginsianum IMI 349063]